MVVLGTLLWMWTLTIKARTPSGVALIGLGLLCLIRLEWAQLPIRLWKGASQAVLKFIKTPAYSLPALFFLGYLTTALLENVNGFWGGRLRHSIQAVGIPAMFFILSAIYIRYRDHLYMAMGLFASASALGVGLYLGANSDAIFVAIGQGRVVPTPNRHVRYSMVLAVTAVSMWWYAFSGFSKEQKADSPADWLGLPRTWLRIFALSFAVILTTVLHVIAVRTGLVMFYIGFVVVLTRVLLPKIGKKGVALSLAGCIFLAGVAVTQIPTLSQKLAYVSFDIEQIGKKSRRLYSDAGRFASIRAGIEVIKAYPISGAPNGDFAEAMRLAYAKTGNPTMVHPPHNQFLYSWGAAGILGFLGVCAVLIGPLIDRKFWRKPLLAEGWLMISAMFMIELPLESDNGIGICLLALYLPKIGEGLARVQHKEESVGVELSPKPATETS